MARPQRIFAGKTVVLTGAGSGIGRCLAHRFAACGSRLVLVDRDRAGLEETVRTGGLADRVAGLVVRDFAEPGAAAAVLREIAALAPAVDVLYHNAGMMVMGQVRNTPWHDMARLQAVNLNVPIQLTLELLPGMIARGGGHIGFTASAAALVTPPGAAAYGMTKAGLVAFAEGLRAEVHRHGIRVTAVCPGFVHSPLAQNVDYKDAASRRRMTTVPRFVGSSPEYVAKRSVAALAKGRGLVVIGWEEKAKRWLKGLSDRAANLLNRGLARLLLDP